MPRDGRPTREKILDTAERLAIDNGFSATSLDRIIAESGTSKGAFFHHFASKAHLASALVDRYAAADVTHLRVALDAVSHLDEAAARVLAFVRFFEDGADDLMSAQSSCLYVAALTERELVETATVAAIEGAVLAWRTELAALIGAALRERDGQAPAVDIDAMADHVFVTFEGAFLLARATGDPGHMRRQLRTLRTLFEALLDPHPAP